MIIHHPYLISDCQTASLHEASIPALLSPQHSSSKFIDFLYASEECKLNVHLQYNVNVSLRGVKIHSHCVQMKLEQLEFNNMDTIINMMPEVVGIGHGVTSNLIIQCSVILPTKLGHFITVHPLKSPNIQFTVFNDNEGMLGVINNANISLFDSSYVSTILMSNQQPSTFRIDSAMIYTYYPVQISGSFDAGKPWDELQMSLNIQFTELHLDVERKVKQLIFNRAEFAKRRINTCYDSKDIIVDEVKELENELTELSENLESISSRLNITLKQQARIEHRKEQIANATAQLFEEYRDTVDSILNDEELCEIEACDKACVGGLVRTYCFIEIVDNRKRPCNKEVLELVKIIKSRAIEKERCIWTRGRRRRISSFGDAVSAFYSSVKDLFTKNKKYTCNRVMYYEAVFDEEDKLVSQIKQDYCDHLVVTKYNNSVCNYNSSCKYLQEDIVCSAKNSECVQNRTETLENVLEENELRELVRGAGISYKDIIRELSEINFEVTSLEIDKFHAQERKDETGLLLESKRDALRIIESSCSKIENEERDGLKLDEILNSTGLESTVNVQSITWDVTLQTETPIVVQLDIFYDIPFLGTSHQTTGIVDMSAPAEITKQTLSSYLLEELIPLYTGSHSIRKREIEQGSLNKFTENCNLIKDLMLYSEFLVSTLHQLHNNTVGIISSLLEEQERAMQRSSDVQITLSSENSNFSTYIKNKDREQTEKYINTIDHISIQFNNSEVTKWQTVMENVHYNIDNVGNHSCYTFGDCLVTSFELIRTLILDMPSELVDENHNSHYSIQNITQITRNGSLSFNEVEDLLKTMSILLKNINEIGYWCASKPEIQTQPQKGSIIPVKNRFSLQCEANSSIPVTYRWKKNGHTLSETKETLMFDHAKVSDIGIYHCEASNAVGTSSSNQATVAVYEAPYSSALMESLNSFTGEDSVQFVCPITGYPEPEFSWYFKSNLMNSWIKLYNNTASSLVVREINSSDEGWYKCHASNIYGNSTSNEAYLTVLPSRHVEINYKFKSILSLSNQTINVSEEDNSELKKELLALHYEQLGIKELVISEFVFKLIGSSAFSVSFSISSEQSNNNLANSNVEILNLEKAEDNLQNTLKNPTNHFNITYQNADYTITPSVMNILSYNFECPQGYELDGSNLICGTFVHLFGLHDPCCSYIISISLLLNAFFLNPCSFLFARNILGWVQVK